MMRATSFWSNVQRHLRLSRAWQWALLVFLAGFSLRVLRLGDHNVWYDEGYSVFMARQASADLPQAIASDGHPILYFALLHGWRALTGDSPLALRYLSALFGVVSLAVGYRLVRRLAGRRAAVLALALFAVQRSAIWHSQEIRMYGLALLLALVALACATAWVDRGGWRSLLGYGLAVSAGIHTLYLFILAPLALNVALLVVWVRRGLRQGWKPGLVWIGAQILTIASTLPWLMYALTLRPNRFTQADVAGPLDVLGLWLNTWLVGTGVDLWSATPLYLLAAIAVGLAGGLAWRSRRRPGLPAVLFMTASLVGALATVGVVWALNVPSPIQMTFTPAPRYVLMLTPWAMLGLAIALDGLLTHRPRLGLVLTAALTIGIAWPVPDYYADRILRDSYRSAALTLAAQRGVDDALLLHNDNTWPVVDFDLGSAPRAGVPNGLAIDAANAASIAAPLWDAHAAVWVLVTRESLQNDFDQRIIAWFQQRAVASRMWDFSPDARLWVFARTPERTATLDALTAPPPATRGVTIAPGLELVAVEQAVTEVQVGETLRLFLYWRAEGAQAGPPLGLRLGSLWGGTADEIPIQVPDLPEGLLRQQVDLPIRPYVGAGHYHVALTSGIGGAVLDPSLAQLSVPAAAGLPAAGPPLPNAVDAVFQNGLALTGWDATTGESGLIVRVTWQAANVIDRRAKQFWHLVGPETDPTVRAQIDAEPLNAHPPLTAWPPGVSVLDQARFALPDDLPPGRYTIWTGLYDPITALRLPVNTAAGIPLGDAVALGTVDLP